MYEKGSRAFAQLVDGNRGVYSNGLSRTGEGESIELISPSTGSSIGKLSEASEEQLDAAVQYARDAFAKGTWARDRTERARVLRHLAELVEANAEEIAYLDAIEAGKVFTGSVDEDVPDVVANLRFFADRLAQDEGRFLQDASGWGWVRNVPVGVVGVVLPWNFPIAMLGWKVAPALAAGNAIVVKPSEDSVFSALHFAKLATEAGVPDGALNVVTGAGSTIGRAMGLHPNIDVLTFTGSGPTGRSFLESSAKSNLKKVSLELGGRAGYVIDSVHASDFESIAKDVAGAAFGTSGQNCTASSRVMFIGNESEYNRFRDTLVAAAGEIGVGDPLAEETAMGPIINAKAHNRITAWIHEALDNGARVVNDRAEVPVEGYWLPPTIVEGVPPNSELGRGEVFGPVTQLIRMSSREAAVRAINDEPYGLASTVWCEDLATVKWWTDQLRVGTLAINGYSEGTVATPFGGMRQSGFWGRDNGPEALDTYQEAMTVWVSQG